MGYVESLMGKNEKILIIERQHWTTLLMSFLVNLFLIIVILALYAVLGNNSVTSNPSLSFLPIVRSILLFVLLYPVGRFGWDFVQWEAEQYLVTSHRVMQTEGIVNKKTTDSSLEKVNDIVLTQSFLGRILGYGDLEIVTGSDIGVNLLKRLAQPITFKTTLLDAKAAMNDFDDGPRSHPAAVPVAGGLMGAKPKAGTAGSDDDDPLKRIAELDNLRKSGAISDAEYQSAKVKLLSKI